VRIAAFLMSCLVLAGTAGAGQDAAPPSPPPTKAAAAAPEAVNPSPPAAGDRAAAPRPEAPGPALGPDGRVGPGKGIFVTGPRNMVVFPDAAKRNPLVAGFQYSVSWAELEPRKGQYDWAPIDRILKECAACGKQAAFKFSMVGGKVMSDSQLARGKGRAGEDVERDNDVTPAWLFDDPQVKRLGGIKSPKGAIPLYPVFWDPAYQKHLEEFLAAMAKRYDGNPRIEYIRMAGWQVGTNEPSFYGGASEFLAEQLAREGMKVDAEARKKGLMRGLPGDGPYARAVLAMIDLWRKHFTKTRLAATIHFSKEKGSFEEALMEHCLANRIMIMNTGLNESDHAESRRQYREVHDKRGVKVAWGGITHMGTKLSAEALAAKGRSLRMEAVIQGIGDDAQTAYAPASRASYLVLGLDFLEDAEAVRWAQAHLAD
jgi:hypothetical protein